jgi:hypothetical protein
MSGQPFDIAAGNGTSGKTNNMRFVVGDCSIKKGRVDRRNPARLRLVFEIVFTKPPGQQPASMSID